MRRWMEDIDAMLRDIAPSWHSAGCLEPLIHMREEDEEIVISADLPCVKKEDIDIYCTEDAIEIRAKMTRDLRFERWGTVQREITFNSFRRSIALPAQVVPERARASFRGGILEIRLPKKIKKTRIKIE